MRVAVTGAGGRLGRAVVAALAEAPFTGISGPLAWRRPAYDLDDPGSVAGLIARDRPEVIVHAAAWTDVDGCARDPELAQRRNGDAVEVLAGAAAEAGVDLILVSTNEVFDGRRTDGLGYTPADVPNPINAYGASKLAGERAASAAFAAPGRPAGLAIVRTAWLYGPPGNDFPEKIARAAERARAAGEALRVVGDETGSPTSTTDLADAIVELIGAGGPLGGIQHIVNGGAVTRAGWARAVLAGLAIEVSIEEVPAATWVRASTPPAWAVLDPTPLPSGEPLRPWPAALADQLPALRRRLLSVPA
ncbi:MAG TPA: SDR family oxidoreductase [Candidatus Limnocylindrales bacterium]|nr:SDR family oxidoreductase [Candidatus Limnocylindrales bacterium]